MCFLPHARRLMVSVLAALLLGALATAAHAAEPPLTLEAAVQRGVARAPQLDARAADTAAAREESARAGQLPDPTLTFGLSNFPVTNPGAFSLRSDGMTRSEEHTSELQSLMRISYAVFCLKKKKKNRQRNKHHQT